MATQQPNTDFVFEIQQIKDQVGLFASQVGLDVKNIRLEIGLTNSNVSALSLLLTDVDGEVTALSTELQGVKATVTNLNTNAIVQSNLTTTSNLNTIAGSRVYKAPAGVAALARNYPVEEPGTLTQTAIGTSKTQQYLTVTGLFYVRGYNGSAWSTWRSI